MHKMSFNNDSENSSTAKSEQLLWTILDGVLLVGILFGNILTICAVCWSRRLSNILSNHFVLSLAVSDLLVGLALPYHMSFYLWYGLGDNKHACTLRFVLIIMPCCVSMYNLIVIAVDRYIAIVHPLHYCRYMTHRVATFVVASGWFAAFTLSTVPAYWNQFDETKKCELDKVLPKVYISFILTPAFSLVWIAMFALYWRIWREAAGHARRLHNASNLNECRSDWKSVQMVMLILGCFSVCWLPFFIVICTTAYKMDILDSSLTYQITFSMGMANSCINPIIYAGKNTEFRMAFGKLLTCQSPNRAQPRLVDVKDIHLHTIENTLEEYSPSMLSRA